MTREQRAYASNVFAALANPARLHILETVAGGPASVNEIAGATGLKQSLTSQHLATLTSAGVLVWRPNGRQRIYSLRELRIGRILELAEEFFEVHVEALRELLATTDRKG